MKRAAVAVLLVAGCRATMPSVPRAAPPWAPDAAIWVDPNGSATGIGTSPDMMAKAADMLTKRLVADGFRRGSPDEPGTFVIKSTVNTAPGNFAMVTEITRDGRRIEVQQMTSSDLPCWGSVTGQASALECITKVGAERFEDSKPVAAAHGQRAAQAPAPSRAALKGRLAVLDLRNQTRDLETKDVRYFTDMVRAAVLKHEPQLEVMTRENLIVLLQASGKDLSSCEGECEVDTGRRIGADQIISGDLVKIGSRYKLSLRLHETHDGRLLGAAVASGNSIDELDESANKAVAQLFGVEK